MMSHLEVTIHQFLGISKSVSQIYSEVDNGRISTGGNEGHISQMCYFMPCKFKQFFQILIVNQFANMDFSIPMT